MQENLQENDPLQEEMQIETEKEEKEEKEDSPESAAKEQTAVSEEELDLEDDIENGYFHFLRPSDGLIAAFFVPVAVLIILFAHERHLPFWLKSAFKNRTCITSTRPSFLSFSTS